MIEYLIFSIGACLIALPLFLPSEDPRKLSRSKGRDGEYLVLRSRLPDSDEKINRMQQRGKYFLAFCRLVTYDVLALIFNWICSLQAAVISIAILVRVTTNIDQFQDNISASPPASSISTPVNSSESVAPDPTGSEEEDFINDGNIHVSSVWKLHQTAQFQH